MKVYLDEGAFLPTRAHETDAGLDLRSREEKIIPAHGSAEFDTGVHIRLPKGTAGKLESKSGLNLDHDIVSCGGLIDEPYTGSIKAKLYNLGGKDYKVEIGEKIVQLVIKPVIYEPVDLTIEWSNDTDRGENGFGSSGRF